MTDGQPIETAPRDGTPILAHDPTIWDPDLDNGFGDYSTDNTFLVVRWVEIPNGGIWRLAHYSAFSFNPTHWWPLPEPPKKPKA